MKKLLAVLALFLPLTTHAAYNYSRTVTIDHTQVSSTLSNFTVLVATTTATLSATSSGGHVNNASGYDIAFGSTATCSSPYGWEMERYTAATGELEAWVKLSSLPSSTDTTFYMCYGDSALTTFQGGATSSVWDSAYVGIYHLRDGTTLSALDSSVQGNNGTINGASAATGTIDGAASFNGTTNNITTDGVAGDIATGSTTISAWVKFTSDYVAGSQLMLIGRSGDDPSDNDVLLGFGDWGGTITDGKLHMEMFNGSAWATSTATRANWSSTLWYYVVGTGDTVTGVKGYVNGVAEGAGVALSGRGGTASTHFDIADSPNGVNTDNFGGTLDEVRISNTIRNSSWILTEYNNQSSPSTFAVIGPEVAPAPPPSFSSVIISKNSSVIVSDRTIPTYRSSAGTAAGTDTSIIGTEPAGAQQNDILIAYLYIESDASVTAPAGWSNSFNGTTMMVENNTGGSAYRSYAYWIRRGASAPDLTWTFASAFRALFIVDYSGAITSGDPWSFGTVKMRDDTSAKTYPDTNGTTTTMGERLIWQGNGFDVGGAITYPTGFSAPVDGTSFGTAIADKVQNTGGATGNITGASYAGGTNNTTGDLLVGLMPIPGASLIIQ